MIWRPRIPKRLVTLARVCSAPVFLLSLCMFIRTTAIDTNDLFHFGHGGSWWCYAIVNFNHVSASVDIYDPAYRGSSPAFDGRRGDWFYFHLTANGGTWGLFAGEGPKRVAYRDLGVYDYQRYEVNGHPAWTSHGLNLGPIFPISLLASAAVLGMWIRAFIATRRARFAGRCGMCGYDLRAHKAGDKCPECGTMIPAPV